MDKTQMQHVISKQYPIDPNSITESSAWEINGFQFAISGELGSKEYGVWRLHTNTGVLSLVTVSASYSEAKAELKKSLDWER